MNSFASFLGTPALVVGLSIAMTGCGPTLADQKNEAPMPVKVSLPVQREITDYSEVTGRVAAVDSVEVRPRVWGYIDKVNFKEGMLVDRDDVLVQIDPRTYKATLKQAEGNLAAAEAKANRLETELKRAKKLQADKAISQQELDKSQFDWDEAVANIESLKGIVDQAKLDVGFTKVVAPISGRIGRALVKEGNLVQASQAGATILTTIVSVDPIWAYFDVDERTVLRVRQMIRAGKMKSAREVPWPVFLGLAYEEGYPHEGTIDFVDNQVNSKVGTLRVRGVFPNKDEHLTPGYFCRVRVPIGPKRQALLISDRAIDVDQGQKIVYVVGQDNKVAVRPIRLGSLHDGLRAVEEGLIAADRVVVTGIQQIRPGQVVAPSVVDMPTQKPKSDARNEKELQTSKSQ
jgi:RND family efflux transporter MFP subunit